MINIKTIQSLVKGINIAFLLILLSGFSLSAQDFLFSGSAGLSKKLAEYSVKNGDPYTAIDYYEYYLTKKSNNKIKFKLALLYFDIRDYIKAKNLFNEVYNSQPDKYTLALYYHAQILKVQGQYILAKQEFIIFNKKYKNGKERKKFKKLTKMAVMGCDISNKLKDSVIQVSITKLDTSINSPHIEQSPILIEEEKLLYSTININELKYYHNKEEQEKPKRRLAIATKKDNKWVSTSEYLCSDSTSHIVNGVLSNDRKRFYFNKCSMNYNGKAICHLYVAKYKDGKISNPVALPEHINLQNVTITMPAVTFDKEKDKEIIYFSSNMQKGKGGMDLWYVTYDKKRDKYSKPKNLGKNINTPGNELSPFIDNNSGTLYFSSDALPGLGSLDVFKTFGSYRKWMQPENIGMPINSGFDELYYTINKDNETGFFTSNRPVGNSLRGETCCDDIFEFNYNAKFNFILNGKLFIENSSDVNLLLHKFLGKFDDSKMLENTNVSIYMIDPKTQDTIYISTKSPDINGNFNLTLEQNKDYKIVISNSNINPKNLIISTKGKDPNINNIINQGDIGIEALPSEDIKVNIFYEFGSAKLNAKSEASMDTLVKILKKIPDIGLLIKSHTDGKGSDAFNLKFSQKRAENILSYLVSKGINKDRLKATGYGESQPVEPNSNPDGSDNPKGREKNRRTEIRFVKKSFVN